MVLIRHFATCCLLLLLWTAPGICAPATEPAAGSKPAETQPLGLSEIGPRLGALTDFADQSENRLAQLSDLQATEKVLATVESQLGELRQSLAPLGDPKDWYIDRLLQFNNQYLRLKQVLVDQQNELSGRQQEIEQISARLTQEEDFLQKWRSELRAQQLKVPTQTVEQFKKLLQRLQQARQKSSGLIVKQQERIGTIQQEVAKELDIFSGALSALRLATFRKNSPSFFSRDFHARFTRQLYDELVQGWQAASSIDPNYLLRYGWGFVLMILAGLSLSFSIRRYAGQLEEHEEWHFVLRHPFATGSFVTLLFAANLFPAPPAQLRYLLVLGAVMTGSVLASSLCENRRQIRMLYLGALVLMLTTGLRLIAFPLPYFRIYIALLALLTIPLLIGQVRSSRRDRKGKGGRFFRGLLRLAILVLTVALVAQVLGFVNFSSWLLQATFETGMLLLFAHMLLRLGRGGIDFLISRKALKEHKFFKLFGDELAQRFDRLLLILVDLYALFYLLPLWRVFPSSREAWGSISHFAFSVGTLEVSLQMLVLAVLTLYLTLQISWLLQSLFEVRFYRKSVDRGVRDAIKKLVHYGMVTLGFLGVLSLLGMSLQNFVVVLGAFGVGIGFGLQDIVNNFLSGLILLFERPVKVGDLIVVTGEWGFITKIGLRSTVVETIEHAEIIVPNSQLISDKVTNWTHSSRVARVTIPVGVAYGSDVALVMKILSETAAEHPATLDDPPPSILFMAFGNSSLDFEARVFIGDISAQFRVRSEILQQIDARFREAGVEIPFPQRDLHLRSVDADILDGLGPRKPQK